MLIKEEKEVIKKMREVLSRTFANAGEEGKKDFPGKL